MTPNPEQLVASIDFWFQAIAVSHDLDDVFEYGASLPDLLPGEIDKLIEDIFTRSRLP